MLKLNIRRLCRIHSTPLLLVAGGISIVLSGCQSFQSSPLASAEYAAAWETRRADSQELEDFATHLAANSSQNDFDVKDGLELEEAEIVSLFYNPQLRLERSKAGVAEANAANAGLWKDPELNVDVLRLTESVPKPWILGSAISFTIPISGRLQVEKKRAQAQRELALMGVAESEWEIGYELRQAWFTWSANLLKVKASEMTLRVFEGMTRSLDALLQSGEVSEVEAAFFSIEQISLRADILHLKRDLALGEFNVKELMGLSPQAPVTLCPRLVNAKHQDAARSVVESNLTLSRLKAAYAVAELTFRREIRKQYPDLVLGPQFESDEGQSSLGAVGGIRLPLINRNKAGIAEAQAKREVARVTYEAELERLSSQLLCLQASQQAVLDQQKMIRGGLVPAADRNLARAQRLIKIGEGGATELMGSVLYAHEAKLRLIQLELEASEISNQIRYLLGPLDRSNSLQNSI